MQERIYIRNNNSILEIDQFEKKLDIFITKNLFRKGYKVTNEETSQQMLGKWIEYLKQIFLEKQFPQRQEFVYSQIIEILNIDRFSLRNLGYDMFAWTIKITTEVDQKTPTDELLIHIQNNGSQIIEILKLFLVEDEDMEVRFTGVRLIEKIVYLFKQEEDRKIFLTNHFFGELDLQK